METIQDAVQKKDTDEWAMVYPASLGDTYIACGFAEAILEQHGGKNFTAYVSPEAICIPKMFEKITAVRTISESERKKFIAYPFKKNHSNIIYAHFPFMDMPRLIGYKGITLADCYRALFRLSLDAKISKTIPNSPEKLTEAKEMLLSRGLRPGRTAIIAPDTLSAPRMKEETIEKILRRLDELSWDYIVNTNNAALFGKFNCFFPPLELVSPLAEVAGWVITARSGLADILSQNPCRLTVFYPYKTRFFYGEFIDGLGLKNMGLRDDAEEFVMQKEEDFIDSVLR